MTEQAPTLREEHIDKIWGIDEAWTVSPLTRDADADYIERLSKVDETVAQILLGLFRERIGAVDSVENILTFIRTDGSIDFIEHPETRATRFIDAVAEWVHGFLRSNVRYK